MEDDEDDEDDEEDEEDEDEPQTALSIMIERDSANQQALTIIKTNKQVAQQTAVRERIRVANVRKTACA